MIQEIIKNIVSAKAEHIEELIKKTKGFKQPYKNPQIYENLCQDDIYHVDDFLRVKEIKEAIDIFREVESTFHPVGMNPHLKEYPPDKFFVESNLDTKLFEAILNAIEDKHRNSILHIGNKGSGKTISQNILLYRRNKELEKNKIFWVRCDCHKLYNLWRKQSNLQKLAYAISIQEYLDIQLVYVLCKYYKKSKLLNEIYLELKKQEIKFDYLMSHDIHSDSKQYKKNVLAYKFIEKLESEINNHENNNPQTNFSYAVDKIMVGAFKSAKQRAKKRWIDLSLCIQTFMHKNEYKILFIVDGIDNVNLNIPSSKPMYIEMKSQFADFVRKRPKNLSQIHLASLRTRTLNEMQNLITESSDTFHYSNPKNLIFFRQEKYDFTFLSEILHSRYEYVVNEVLNPNLKYTRIIDEITRFVLKKDILDKSTDDLYHENCRNYLMNRFGLIKLIFFRFIQQGKPSNFDIERAYNVFESTNMFLNSRLFLDSRQGYFTDYGDYAFNIFNYPTNRNLEKIEYSDWKGLSCIRILQLLKSNFYERTTDTKIINCLSTSFGYTEELIEFHLERLRDFGLIDSYLFISQFSKETEIEFKINKKGVYLFDKIFSSFEILYTLCLDTLLPSSLIDDLNYIDSYKTQVSVNTNYPQNSIKSVLSFICFLSTIEKYEMSQLQKHSDCEIGIATYKKYFKLPFEENYLGYESAIESYTSFLGEDEINEINERFNTAANKG